MGKCRARDRDVVRLSHDLPFPRLETACTTCLRTPSLNKRCSVGNLKQGSRGVKAPCSAQS